MWKRGAIHEGSRMMFHADAVEMINANTPDSFCSYLRRLCASSVPPCLCGSTCIVSAQPGGCVRMGGFDL